jgi:hypothetical protein
MAKSLPRLWTLFWLFNIAVVGALGQLQFVKPDGTKADFSESYNTGEMMEIEWKSGSLNRGDSVIWLADLWVTWFHATANYEMMIRCKLAL